MSRGPATQVGGEPLVYGAGRSGRLASVVPSGEPVHRHRCACRSDRALIRVGLVESEERVLSTLQKQGGLGHA